jgi:Polyketide cyclase / dehydrase and lipid transport
MTNPRFLIPILLSLQCVVPSYAAENAGEQMVSQRAVLDAPVNVVWNALRKERMNDPQHRQVLSSGGGDYVIKERFEHLPVVGDATCTYKEHEVPMSKLQYQMVASDKLKAFEGVWELTPHAGNKTVLQLSSRIDTGISMPFCRQITRDATMKSIDKRLTDIKELVASQQVADASVPSL